MTVAAGRRRGFPRPGFAEEIGRPPSPPRRGALPYIRQPLGGNRWGRQHLFYAGDNLAGLGWTGWRGRGLGLIWYTFEVDDYLEWLRQRLQAIRRVMVNDGSI